MTGVRRGSVAIVGAAESDLGKVAPHMQPVDLMAQATLRALEDCGLTLDDVDGVFAATSQMRMPSLALCAYLGLKPRYFDGTNIGGASFMSHVAHAHARVPALVTVCGAPSHPLYKEQGKMFFRLRKIRGINGPQKLICFDAGIKSVHQLEKRLFAANRFVD